MLLCSSGRKSVPYVYLYVIMYVCMCTYLYIDECAYILLVYVQTVFKHILQTVYYFPMPCTTTTPKCAKIVKIKNFDEFARRQFSPDYAHLIFLSLLSQRRTRIPTGSKGFRKFFKNESP